MTITTKARHLGLEEFEAILRKQHELKLDGVVPATAVVAVGGDFHITGMGTTLPEGVSVDALFTSGGEVGYGVFAPSDVAIGHFADKLRIPVEFLRRMRRERPDIFDMLVNSLLHGSGGGGAHFAGETAVYPADSRRFFVRSFVDPDGGPGVLRALLSDSYRSFENLDVLMTVLEAMMEVDPDLHVLPNARVTEQRISFTVSSPRIVAAAPTLLAGYRNPFGDDGPPRWTEHGFGPDEVGPRGRVGDLVSAGIGVSNSEVGHGKLQLDAKFTVLACTNGLTMTHDIGRFARVHLGAKNTADGIVRWSEGTHKANLDLVRAMTRDAVNAFVNPEYLAENLARIEEKAGREVEDPQKTIEIVRKELGFSQDTAATVLRHFIRGGQSTVAGVVQAVTSAAQVTEDGDEGFLMEQQAMRVLEAAYRAA